MAQTGADDDEKAQSLQPEFASRNGVGDDKEELRSQWATRRDEAWDKVRVIDVTNLEAAERHLSIENLVKQIQADNLHLLRKIRKRIDEVGIELPMVEVRFSDLSVEAECEVVHGKPIPTLWNTIKGILSKKESDSWQPRSHFVEYGVIDSKGNVVDEGRCNELQCHGSEVCLWRVLRACFDAGARLTEPGEFTLRAFLNGGLDLTQAENIEKLISSKSSAAADVALEGIHA
ncbi:unnamed protein product [Eruca vesicaria subsp. sativa]|uniref:GTP-binding protein TrmE N-terminal domain-containing protein n=1 Tax=Eruca vesicaria subsp. sativa TaxID=29727 RepID=A0ABC8LS59_ERUVS|nr:unnamed protein product [Eruca vesicaria subsp. sativa]